MPTDDGTSGQALITDGSGVLSWSTAASGDVYGPASATDNAIARFDLTTGKIIQNSVVTIADDGATVIAANSASDGLRITQIGAGNALLVEDSANPDASPVVIDASGRFVLGNTTAITMAGSTPPIQLQTAGGSAQQALASWGINTAHRGDLQFMRSASGVVGTQGVVANNYDLGAVNFYGDDGTAFIQAAQILSEVDGTPGTNDMPGRLTFSTTADGASTVTERMRIDSTGAVGIGATPVVGRTLTVAKSMTGAATANQILASSSIQSDVTTDARFFATNALTQATAFTLTSLNHYIAIQSTIGAGSTVTTQYGFHANSTLIGATNNYGFYSNIASGTNRWNFYAAGTAANVFVGTTSIGGTVGSESLRATPVASSVNYLEVVGAVTTASPAIQAAGSDTNIDLTLTPKGTGNVRFGTLTANADAPITGYITIKDAGGTTRKLAIIA
jgi:hypothetical protein